MKSLILSISISFSGLAHAGNEGSGGGGAISILTPELISELSSEVEILQVPNAHYNSIRSALNVHKVIELPDEGNLLVTSDDSGYVVGLEEAVVLIPQDLNNQ